MLGCRDTNPGQAVQDNGPLKAYERELVFDLDACGADWKALTPHQSQCKINQTMNENQYIWNAGRIVLNWQYYDSLWSGDVSIYYTHRGYQISLIGFRSEPKEHYSFEVAQKYISSAILKFKSKPAYQILLIPSSDKAPQYGRPLGSVILVNRSIDLKGLSLLSQCQRTWKNGQCYIDVINGSFKESLLENSELTINLRTVFIRANGFAAWSYGSGLSDYKIFMGAHDSNTSFSQFRQAWLAEMSNQALNLKVQKFSVHRPKSYYQDQFVRYIDLDEWVDISHQ